MSNEFDLKEALLNILKENSPLGKADLLERLPSKVSERTLQRTLGLLVGDGQILSVGKARATKYSLPPVKAQEEISTPHLPSTAWTISSLKGPALKAFKYVTADIVTRKPVGYNQDFLRDYIPNKTFYLDTTIRKKLLELGTVDSKQKPAGTYARNILNRLLIDLSWNSSRLEGNNYSLLETKRLLELGEYAEGKEATEAQMILNHKAAIEFLIENASEIEFNSYTICSLHALLSDNLLGDPAASGKLRENLVSISGTTYLPLENPHIIEELFNLLLEKAQKIQDPFEQAFFALIHISYLQAFEDVNKRTSRLAANIPLVKRNLKPLSFTDVPKQTYITALVAVYELNDISLFKDLFAWAYERSTHKYSAIQQSLGEPDLFKLKHRDKIQEVISDIVLRQVPGKKILAAIQEAVRQFQMNTEDSQKLSEIIEKEIIHLHEGNIARFKIRPSQFRDWKEKQ
ncbi:Fic family protein [Bdellovibrio sp. BCCA]|uniref:Fic family protein n=1 Tax=Bdellovibrio sp. BCCA TaxID=3136281 RepID=UPI0030F271EA